MTVVDGPAEFRADVEQALALLDATGHGRYVRDRIAIVRPAQPGDLPDGAAGGVWVEPGIAAFSTGHLARLGAAA